MSNKLFQLIFIVHRSAYRRAIICHHLRLKSVNNFKMTRFLLKPRRQKEVIVRIRRAINISNKYEEFIVSARERERLFYCQPLHKQISFVSPRAKRDPASTSKVHKDKTNPTHSRMHYPLSS
jgi:hypothetical protein